LLVPKYTKTNSRISKNFIFFYLEFGLRPRLCLGRLHVIHSCVIYPENMPFKRLQLSIFVKPICLSFSVVTEHIQCKKS